MFTVPNGGQTAFVVDGQTWTANRVLLGVGATQATATGTLETDGDVVLQGGAPRLWYNPNTVGIGSSYWVRATLLSGDVPTGSPLNTWLSLSSNRSWSITTSGLDTVRNANSSLSVEIANDNIGSVILGTNTLNINATVDNS